MNRFQVTSPPKDLVFLMIAYGVGSLVHFVHNAEFLAEYPNMPMWLSRADVYVAWLGITAIGVAGYVLAGHEFDDPAGGGNGSTATCQVAGPHCGLAGGADESPLVRSFLSSSR
jgi:hypothetical protein